MRRRDFVTLLGSATVAWPLAVRAQQHEQMRRVAVLLGGLEFGDASGQAEIAALEEGLKKLGWTPGQNIDLDYHWPGAQTARGCAASQTRSSLHVPILYSAARRRPRPR
jgi:putative ABC transport system substrate-binding protein